MNAESGSDELLKIPLFRDLSLGELKSVKGFLKERAYDKGEILFNEGNPCERVFIVQSGRVKIFRMAASGREQILETLGPGDTCACNPGEATWHCSSSAQALTSCRVWFFSRTHYVQLVQGNSKLSHTLNRIFAGRICQLNALVEEVSLDNPRRRLVKFMLDILNTQECRCEDGKCFCIPFTHEEISQRIGLVRETVTRHLNQLKRLKLIDIKSRQIVILDKKGLKKILS